MGRRSWEVVLSKLRARREDKLKKYLYATFTATIAPPSTTKTSSCVGGAIDYIANILKMAHPIHLGLSPFDSASQTLLDMKYLFSGELPI